MCISCPCSEYFLQQRAGRGPNDRRYPEDPFGGGFGDAVSEPRAEYPFSDNYADSKPPLFVRTVMLKFLRAVNLKAALDKMSTINGSISVDEITNSLIVCDTKDNLEWILAEIKHADQTPKQVIIEVFIIRCSA